MSTKFTPEEQNNLVEFFRILDEWDSQDKAVNFKNPADSDAGADTLVYGKVPPKCPRQDPKESRTR